MRDKLIQGLWLTILAVSLGATAGVAGETPDGVTPPEVKARTQMQPFYPATAMLKRVPARVALMAEVRSDGKVGEIEVLGCDQEGLGFEQAAVDSLRHWRFKPARKDGAAVDYYTVVSFDFAAPRSARIQRDDARVFASVHPLGTERLGVPGATAPGAQGGSGISTAAVGSPDPVSIYALFPKGTPREPGQLIDRRGFNPNPRGDVSLPAPVQQRRPTASGRGRGAARR